MGLLNNFDPGLLGLTILANNNSPNLMQTLGRSGLLYAQNQAAMQEAQKAHEWEQVQREQMQKQWERQQMLNQRVDNEYSKTMKITGGIPLDLYKHQNPNYKASDIPSSIRETNTYLNWTPEKQKTHMMLKRAGKYHDDGQQLNYINPITQQAMPVVQNKLKPSETLKYKKDSQEAMVVGKAAGEAKVNLSSDISKAEDAIRVIDEAITHPGRQYATGFSANFPVLEGTDAFGFTTLHNQLKGKQFLEAYKSLRGGGQITEIEGKKAEQSISRLELGLKEDEYLKELENLKTIISKGIERSKQSAGAQLQPSGLKPGYEEDGYIFKGGDPGNALNWRKK